MTEKKTSKAEGKKEKEVLLPDGRIGVLTGETALGGQVVVRIAEGVEVAESPQHLREPE